MCAAIPATSTPGPKAAPPAGATTTCCPTSARARACRHPTTSSSTPARTIPPAHSAFRSVPPCCRRRAISSRRRWRRAFRAATTTDATAAARRALVSLTQHTTRRGKRSSTYHAFLEGETERRPNLTIITGAQATRVVFAREAGELTAKGVEYRTKSGETETANASKEVILSAGAIGSPHLLLLSGIGPRQELEAAGVTCQLDQPHVGKHLKDHLMVPLYFPAPGAGRVVERNRPLHGTRRAARSRRPAAGRSRRRRESSDRTTGPEAGGRTARSPSGRRRASGLAASSLADGVAFFSTGLGDTHSHDAEIICFVTGGDDDLVRYMPQHRHVPLLRRRGANAGAGCGDGRHAGQSGAAAQRGRDRSHQRRSHRASDDPHELLRRSVRHEGHDRGGAPGARYRGALARQPQGRPGDDPAVPRREARLRRRHGAQRRTARGSRACISR